MSDSEAIEDNDDILNQWLHERQRVWSAPDASEEARLKKKIAANRETIASIDSQILLLQAQIDALKEQRVPLQLQLNTCQSLVQSPIRRLSLDLLIEIFQYLDFETTICTEYQSHARISFCQWSRDDAVSTVCFAWNRIICSVAQFWTTYRFKLKQLRFMTESPDVLETLQDLLFTAIKRSKATPLFVYIILTAEKTYNDIGELLQPVLAEMHRWKHLYLEMSPNHLADEGLRCFEDGFGGLESLEYRESDSAYHLVDSQPIQTSNWFSNVPRLREMVYSTRTLGLFKIPWQQLQSLSVENPHGFPREDDVYAGILASATSLRRLESHYGSTGRSDIERRKSLLPITSLKISSNDDFTMLSRCFDLPKLVDLAVQVSSYYERPQPLPQVAPTLKRLELELNIHHADYSPLSYLDSDTCFPKLVELSVASYHGFKDDYYLDEKSLRARFPRVEQVECSLGVHAFTREPSLRAWSSVLRAFTESSGINDTPATVTRLRLEGPLPEEDWDIALLQDLVMRGTNIEVIYLRTGPSKRYARKCIWKLEASDIESLPSFLEEQKRREGDPNLLWKMESMRR